MNKKLSNALWRIYNRPNRPVPFSFGGNLPWDDLDFGRRMLTYHLSETENAASRIPEQRTRQIDWLWQKLSLREGGHLFDVTCGPGLYATEFAQRGLSVHGVDFAPVAIEHAEKLAAQHQLADKCTFACHDVRTLPPAADPYDAAILIYGQLAVMTSEEAQAVLNMISASLKPGAKLCLELLNPEHVDRKDSTWWFTDDGRLWGDAPYLHLGERIWYEDELISAERFQILHLDTGHLDEIILCDQVYQPETISNMLQTAGFTAPTIYPAWDNIGLYDEQEWLVYIATKV